MYNYWFNSFSNFHLNKFSKPREQVSRDANMRRKARERRARSSKTDARFTAKIIARTMKAARAEMRMRNGRRGHDQKRDQKCKWNTSKENNWNIVFQKTRFAIVFSPKVCLFLQGSLFLKIDYGKYSLVQ